MRNPFHLDRESGIGYQGTWYRSVTVGVRVGPWSVSIVLDLSRIREKLA